ncbi:MAG: FAD binding domain-containing protein [Vicinamibacterales bacterium]
MHAPLSAFTLHRPRTLEAALQLMSRETLTPIAGCTDVYVGLHFGTMADRRFLDLWGLNELRGIRIDRGTLRLGALTTYTEMIESSLVRKRVPMLVAASREVGGAQIQNRGTIGGNIANASPAGDTLPVLAAANARVVLRSANHERRVAFNEFYTDYRASARRSDELITAVEIPPIAGRQWWRKVGTRRAQAISKIMMAGVRGAEVRIGIGSVAPTVITASKTAQVLREGGTMVDAQAALASEIRPIDDVRSTGEYRLNVAQSLLARFWSETA